MLWLTADPAHLAGRLNISIHPLAVLTAVSYRIGDGVAVGGRSRVLLLHPWLGILLSSHDHERAFFGAENG